MSAAAGFLAFNALVLAAGAGTLAALGWEAPRRFGHLGLSLSAGAAVVGVLGQLVLVAGLALTLAALVVIALACVAAGVARRLLRPASAAPVRSLSWPERVLFVPLAALLALMGALAAVKPLDRWDAWAFWTPKAKSLVHFDGLEPAYFAGAPNPDYPLLLPALESLVFRFAGSFDAQFVHLELWLLLVAFVVAAFELLRPVARPAYVALFSTLLVLTPATYVEALSAYADVPLAAFVALAAVCSWRWLQAGETRLLGATAVFAAAALATKTEARIFVAALLVTVFALALRNSRRSAFEVAAAGAVALGGLVPWELWRRAHDVSGTYSFEAGLLLERVPRLADASERLALAAVDPRSWLLLVPALALAVVTGFGGPRRDGALLVVGTVGVSFAGLTAVYWGTSYPFEWHLATSADRVVISLVYVAATLAPALLSAGPAVASGLSFDGTDR